MAAKLLKLPRPQLAELRQLVISFERLDPDAAGRMVAAIDRVDAVDEGWTFVMIAPEQNRDVVRWLQANSDRPMIAVAIWMELFTVLQRSTGEILASRDELAERADTSVRNVSRVMTQLEECGAIIKRRSGREVRYFMNPRVATKLPAAPRAAAQAKAPNLKLIEA